MRLIKSLVLTIALALSGANAFGDEPGPDSAPSAMDKLYARLAHTRFPEEAQGLIGEIDHLRLQSGSDTADLLMTRARKARETANGALARQLFDALVAFDPDWSESWSARAGARFATGDVRGAMADIAQTLKREPRDIGSLLGLAAIVADAGDPEAALRVYDRALALAPAYEPAKEARGRAQNQVWSRAP
jgi:tetratricopeptide (TPR) repeat protein